MRRQQLGHPFAVPSRPAAAEKLRHEGVRPFVQQQMPAIVIRRLIEHPNVRTRRIAVHELVVRRHQSQRLELRRDRRSRYARTCQSAVFAGSTPKYAAHSGTAWSKIAGSESIAALARQIGVEHQMPARELANPGDRRPRVVDR